MAVLWSDAPLAPTPDAPLGYWVRLPGMVFNGQELDPDSRGVSGIFQELTGWWAPTSSTGSVEQRPYQHGGTRNKAHQQSRVMPLKGAFHGHDRTALREAFEEFLGNLSIDDLFPLVVQEDQLVRHAMVRMEGTPLLKWRGGRTAEFNIQLVAEDYRRFGGDGTGPNHSLTVALPFTQGGRRRPYTLPQRIDAAVVSGTVDVVNAGTAPAPVVARFDGPVPSPTIRMPDGQWMTFALDVLPGQELSVDFDKRTVKLNGVDRGGSVRGRWLEFSPGAKTLIFDAASYNEAARMTVSWSDSWK